MLIKYISLPYPFSSLSLSSFVMSREPKLMGGGEVADDLNEWEDIQSPFSKAEWDLGLPIHDVSLQIASEAPETPFSTSSSSSDAAKVWDLESESESRWISFSNMRLRLVNEIRRRWRLRLDAGKEKIISRIQKFVPFATNFWLILPVSGILAAGLLLLFWAKIRRRQRRRGRHRQEEAERFIFLIKEKDEKINKLLLEISHMNEMLSERRMVRVVRRK